MGPSRFHSSARASLATRSLAALAALATASCSSDTLFRDFFDADAVGTLPDLTPDGAPAGDAIYLSDPTNPGGQVLVVNSPALSSKSLRYTNVNVPVYSRFVGFMSAEQALASNQKFRARWAGRIDLSSDGSALDVWLGDSHFKALAAMRFDDGNVSVRTSNEPTYEVIGEYSEAENHAVFITVDKGAQEYSVLLVPGSVISGWRPILNPSALGTDRPTLYFQFSEDKSSNASYTVDELVIEKVD